jgi:hypothetical protein
MMVNCNVLWHDVDKRPTTSMSINWAFGPWNHARHGAGRGQALEPPQEGCCHGQVTMSTFSGSRETRELRSSTELQSHSLQQVELKVVSGSKASRGASGILRQLRITQGKWRGQEERLNSKGKYTEYLRVHRRTSLRLALS